jgi:hypothetical protein
MAKTLWDRVMADVAAFYPSRTEDFQALMKTLGDDTAEPDALVAAVVRMLELWSEC